MTGVRMSKYWKVKKKGQTQHTRSKTKNYRGENNQKAGRRGAKRVG